MDLEAGPSSVDTPETSTPEVTALLQAWTAGDDGARDRLIPLVYRELHALAHHYMAGEQPDTTLQTTALVNELYVRLVDVRRIGRDVAEGRLPTVAWEAVRTQVIKELEQRRTRRTAP